MEKRQNSSLIRCSINLGCTCFPSMLIYQSLFLLFQLFKPNYLKKTLFLVVQASRAKQQVLRVSAQQQIGEAIDSPFSGDLWLSIDELLRYGVQVINPSNKYQLCSLIYIQSLTCRKCLCNVWLAKSSFPPPVKYKHMYYFP